MRLRRLRVASYKNLRGCEIEFADRPWLHAVIGSKGSGKSNLIEAILEILVGCYFAKPPQFDFTLEFVAQSRVVVLHREEHRVSITVDGAASTERGRRPSIQRRLSSTTRASASELKR